MMGQLSNAVDGKSALRIMVEHDVAAGTSPRDALVNGVKQQTNTDISGMGPLADLSAGSLRQALAIPYTGAGCPGRNDQQDIMTALAGNI
jgi:hypothetical protein